MAILRVKSGPQKGTSFHLSGGSQVIGRESTGDIQVLDQGISRKHAEVFRIGEIFFIRDLESRNGTFVNEKKISEEILRIGDQVAVGNSVLVFEDRITQRKNTENIFAPEDSAPKRLDPTSTIHLKMTQQFPAAKSPEKMETVEERNLEILFHLSHIVSEEKNLSRLFERVSTLIGKSLGSDHLYLLGVAEGQSQQIDQTDPDGTPKIDVERTFEMLGRYDRDEGQEAPAGVSRGIIADCLRHSRSVLTSDASLDQAFNAMESVVMNQLRSVICVPISALGKGIGVIYIYSNRAEAFKSEDLELAAAVGIQLGSTIEMLKLLNRSDQFFRNSIKTLVAAIEMRSPKDHGRSGRVATYCLSVAKELGHNTQDLRDAWLSGMLHDIGSIPMTEEERTNRLTSETKRNHFARELLRGTKGLEQILPAVEQQNERIDGSGSPEGLQNEAVQPLSRILGICLEFDRLLYEGGLDGKDLTIKEALLRIKEMADKQFDRQTVNALLIAYRNGKLFNHDEEFFELPAG